MIKTVVVLAGGDPPPPALADLLPVDRFVIAADSGFDHARRLGLAVDLLVGDLDSISSEGLAAYTEGLPGFSEGMEGSAEGAAGAGAIEQHPTDKDATDLALALNAALRHQPGEVIVIGGVGGRIDHFLANAALLAADEYSTMNITWLTGTATISVVRSRIELTGHPGDLVSLIPYGGSAVGVTTTGLRWPLTGATLPAGTSVGVSNQLVAGLASVELRSGVLLCIRPG